MTLSDDLKERVVSLYSPEMPMREVAALLDVSLGFVHNVVSSYQKFGQVSNPRPRMSGRRRVLDNNDLTFICEVITAQPTIYLDEI